MSVPLAVLVTVLVAFGTACSGGDTPTDDAAEPAIVEAIPTEEAEPGATPRLEGELINKYNLNPGQCFNRYDFSDQRTGELEERTTMVRCRRPHDGEVYTTVVHPGGPEAGYPGLIEMERWANAACFDLFGDYVGLDYVNSTLEIGSIRPTEGTWSDPVGRHREVICYVYAPGAQLSGSMAGSAL